MRTSVSRIGAARHAIAALRWLPLGLAVVAAGCGGAHGELAPPAGGPAADHAVRVRLVFGGDVDLDLYVTGPSQETVYYANEASREGGALEADLRCEDAAPRTESVVFPVAPNGRYRVGVDFPHRCDTGVDRAPYLLIVEAPGQAAQEWRGEAAFGVFASKVAEFRVGDGAR